MKITDAQHNYLSELIETGTLSGVNSLNEMLCGITFSEPEIKTLIDEDSLSDLNTCEQDFSSVQIDYYGTFAGEAKMIIKEEDAHTMLSVLSGEVMDQNRFDQIKKDSLEEIGNVFINAIMGEISNIFFFEILYSVPEYDSGSLEKLIYPMMDSEDQIILFATSEVSSEESDTKSEIYIFFTIKASYSLLEVVNNLLENE